MALLLEDNQVKRNSNWVYFIISENLLIVIKEPVNLQFCNAFLEPERDIDPFPKTVSFFMSHSLWKGSAGPTTDLSYGRN